MSLKAHKANLGVQDEPACLGLLNHAQHLKNALIHLYHYCCPGKSEVQREQNHKPDSQQHLDSLLQSNYSRTKTKLCAIKRNLRAFVCRSSLT